jgi:hypothetical protein
MTLFQEGNTVSNNTLIFRGPQLNLWSTKKTNTPGNTLCYIQFLPDIYNTQQIYNIPMHTKSTQ